MVYALVFTLVLFVVSVICLLIGRRLGARDTEGQGSTGVIEAAMFGLMGLVLAFTFSHAADQFDSRRHLIIEETNNIGTAWLRIDLLPPTTQPPIRALFRDYLDARLATYASVKDRELTSARIARANAIQSDIWSNVIAACRERNDPATTNLVISAINTMFDIESTRIAVTQLHSPDVVFVMLGVLAMICSLLAGRSMPRRYILHLLSWSLMLSITVYVIINLEYPRLGFIRIDAFDRVLADLRATMN